MYAKCKNPKTNQFGKKDLEVQLISVSYTVANEFSKHKCRNNRQLCGNVKCKYDYKKITSPANEFVLYKFMLREIFSSFDEMLIHLKLQTFFVLPGLISAIRSFRKFH